MKKLILTALIASASFSAMAKSDCQIQPGGLFVFGDSTITGIEKSWKSSKSVQDAYYNSLQAANKVGFSGKGVEKLGCEVIDAKTFGNGAMTKVKATDTDGSFYVWVESTHVKIK